jgi:hypothetical protein
MPDDADTDLAFAATDDLVAELATRSDHLVVLMILKTDVTPNEQALTVHLRGNAMTTLRMMSTATQNVLDDLDAD